MINTKEKILKAATDEFVSKGYSGTSISDIAKSADINQSLIYHHIGNKENLWMEVKKILIGNLEEEIILYDSFDIFVEYIIDLRIKIYEKDPRILRLIQWQMLEDENDLTTFNQTTLKKLTEAIEFLQQNDEITKDYPANLILIYIHSLVNGLLFDPFKIFVKQNKLKKQYIDLIKHEVIKTFKPQLVKL